LVEKDYKDEFFILLWIKNLFSPFCCQRLLWPWPVCRGQVSCLVSGPTFFSLTISLGLNSA
jgi:hypothetical protein